MSLSLLDWRRRTAGLYAEVRRLSDPTAAHELWCRTRLELLSTHPDSPVPPGRRETHHPVARFAPYDPGLRFEVPVERDVTGARIEQQTGTDGVVAFERIGRADVPGVGTLDVWWLCAYGGGVFVPVKDATSGPVTYGGGRYLIDTVKGADLGGEGERLILDFNFAYNPSCAYDPAWACPLAPPGNTVGCDLLAGELLPPGPTG